MSPTICVDSCLPTSAATWHLSPGTPASQLFPELYGQQSLQHLRAGLGEGVIIDYFYLTEKTSAQAGEKAYFIQLTHQHCMYRAHTVHMKVN